MQEFHEVIYTGDVLKEAVYAVKETREMMIHSLIPRKSNTMFFAPDGVGKSTIILQKILEGTCGADVFGGFKSRPMNTILLLSERPKDEVFERIQYMAPVIPIDWNKLIVDDEIRGLDLISETDYEKFLDRILFLSKWFEDRGGTDYVFIDTLYGAVSDGLSSEKACGQVNKLLRRLQSILGCSTGFTHHTNRGQRNAKSGKREHEDMYGNRALSSNCTGVFHLTKTDEGILIERRKDSMECLTAQVSLKFDPETYISLMNIEHSTKFAYQKIERFLNDCHKLKKHVTFNQILEATEVSVSYLRDQLSVYLREGKIANLKPKGEKALYWITRDY